MLGIEGSTFTVDGIDRGSYPDGKSLVLDGSADYLSQTFSASNRDTWTFSCWVKRSNLGAAQDILSAGTNGSNYTEIKFDGSDKLQYAHVDASSTTDQLVTTAVYRDTHKWMHIVCAVDTTNATEANRVRIYVDGSEVTALDTANYPVQNVDTDINSAVSHTLGERAGGAANFNGYLSRVDFIDGTQYAASDFGETSTDTDKWVMKVPSGLTYGTNGYILDFNDDRSSTPDTTTTIYDQSVNSNNWTGNSLVTGSFTSDVPNNSYATFNPLHADLFGTVNFAEGNLKVTSADANTDHALTTIPIRSMETADVYFEVTVNAVGNSTTGQVTFTTPNNANLFTTGNPALGTGGWGARWDGYYFSEGSTTAGPLTTWNSTSDVLSVHVLNGDVFYWVNNTAQNSGSAILTGLSGDLFVHFGGSVGTDSMTFNFGQKPFVNTNIPSSYKTLSSANLPVPAVPYRKPQNFADILLYTGDGVAIGSGGKTISGLSFTPDFAWFKDRTTGNGHNWFDKVRGATNYLRSDTTGIETTNTETLDSFTSDGGVVGSNGFVNTNTDDYWSLWLKADNTSGSSNTDGSITTTVSAGQHFSIVEWSGDGVTTITAGHGLPFAPDLIILKDTVSAGGWQVYHSSNTSEPETDYLLLHDTPATVDNVNRWNDTAPTSTVFTVHSNINKSGTNNMIAYCFVFDSTDANSPFTGGFYEGNNSTDGTFIPSDGLQMLMYKAIDTTGQWYIRDAVRDIYNPSTTVFAADSNTTEASYGTGQIVDLLSNGWKCRQNGTTAPDMNAVETYIWWGIKKDGSQLWA